jgi:hypothetical protein
MFRNLEFGVLRLDFRIDLELVRRVLRWIYLNESYIPQGWGYRNSGRNGEA